MRVSSTPGILSREKQVFYCATNLANPIVWVLETASCKQTSSKRPNVWRRCLVRRHFCMSVSSSMNPKSDFERPKVVHVWLCCRACLAVAPADDSTWHYQSFQPRRKLETRSLLQYLTSSVHGLRQRFLPNSTFVKLLGRRCCILPPCWSKKTPSSPKNTSWTKS